VATAPVATTTHITKRNESGKRNRFPTDAEKNGEVGRTPRGVTIQENGDDSPKFRLPRLEVNPMKRDGLPPGEQRLRAACNGDNLAVADYMMSEMQFFFDEKMTKVLACLTATEKQLQTVLDAQNDTLRELSSVKSMLDTHGIQQNRIAATVAQAPAERREEERKGDQKRMEVERRKEGQKRMEAGRREEGQKRMEAGKERVPEERRRGKARRRRWRRRRRRRLPRGSGQLRGGPSGPRSPPGPTGPTQHGTGESIRCATPTPPPPPPPTIGSGG
jgi:hypothetical protein